MDRDGQELLAGRLAAIEIKRGEGYNYEHVTTRGQLGEIGRNGIAQEQMRQSIRAGCNRVAGLLL